MRNKQSRHGVVSEDTLIGRIGEDYTKEANMNKSDFTSPAAAVDVAVWLAFWFSVVECPGSIPGRGVFLKFFRKTNQNGSKQFLQKQP